MNITEQSVIGQLVAEDYRTAEVFGKYGIDFCCKGDLSIGQACEKKKVNSVALLDDLKRAIERHDAGNINFQEWPLDLLADYIEKKHHRYVNEKTPMLLAYLDKVSRVHGEAHPELREIAAEFREGASVLAAHMKKEELVLFPFIRRMALSGVVAQASFGTVENPIAMMRHEHENEGERFRRIAQLSGNYAPPAGACNTYRVTYSLLKEFEEDLHLHIHLENNILFPRALAMEAQLGEKQCSL